MQRLHATAEHFRPAGQLSNVAHGNSGIAEQPRRASGRNDFDSHRCKFAREFHHAGFVVHADQRPLNRHGSASDENGLTV